MRETVRQESKNKDYTPEDNDSTDIFAQGQALNQDGGGTLEQEITQVEDGGNPTVLGTSKAVVLLDAQNGSITESRLIKKLMMMANR